MTLFSPSTAAAIARGMGPIPLPPCILCGRRGEHVSWCEELAELQRQYLERNAHLSDAELAGAPAGDGDPAGAAIQAVKDPRPASVFRQVAAAAGYDLEQPADAEAARHNRHLWDATESVLHAMRGHR